ncbi:MAG: CapA family protein [Bacteroidales bacterium]|nr:CapA family protein [Bacteroidales bacterium]
MSRRLAVTVALFLSLALRSNGQDTLRMCFLGDVMAHLPQTEAALKHGYDSYFSHFSEWLATSDINVANMEETIGVSPYTGYPCFSAPMALAEAVSEWGVGVFLMANNHICDKGRSGLDSTFAVYDRLPVKRAGAYRNQLEEEMVNPLILTTKGIKVAFINFTYGTNGIPVPSPYVISKLDSVTIKTAIARGRERGADLIVALPHWGEEYRLTCSREQKLWAERLYRWGVDMIVGSHPHVVQEVEYDGRHLTAYSLGNWVSNMSVPFSQIGMLLSVGVTRCEGRVRILPPEVVYTWCGRRGHIGDNYTVVPISECVGHPEMFRSREQYNKLVSEWKALQEKQLPKQ